MIKECKKCGSKNLYLEPRVKGQDILSADIVALKCEDCGFRLKWCPKDERKFYLKQPKDKWQKLKEFIKTNIEDDEQEYEKSQMPMFAHYLSVERFILNKMQELEGEDE